MGCSVACKTEKHPRVLQRGQALSTSLGITGRRASPPASIHSPQNHRCEAMHRDEGIYNISRKSGTAKHTNKTGKRVSVPMGRGGKPNVCVCDIEDQKEAKRPLGSPWGRRGRQRRHTVARLYRINLLCLFDFTVIKRFM